MSTHDSSSLQRALEMLVDRLRTANDPHEAIQQLADEQAEMAPTFTAIGALFRVGRTTRFGTAIDHGQDDDTEEFSNIVEAAGLLSIDDLQLRSDSRYEVGDEVARGGMGVIYRVRDLQLNRTLAMKVMRAGKVPYSVQHLAQFLEEVQVTAQLDHPGIVAVHELGVDVEGRPFFTMKLVKGQDFSEIMTWIAGERDGWNLSRAVGALVKVCQTVAYAHSKKVIHRDIKPSNIMVGRFGEVYIMDWGLAKVQTRPDMFDLRIVREGDDTLSRIQTSRTDETEDSPLITMDGTVVGTPSFMSLEQARGEVEQIDQRSDVYSLGAVLYQLLVGTPPHSETKFRLSPRTILARVIDGPPTPISQLSPQAPPELIAICDKAMAREKSERYESALGMAEDLQAWLDSRVVRAYRTGPVAELQSWVRRNRLAASIAAAAITVLFVVGGWWLRSEQYQAVQTQHRLATNYLRYGQTNCEQGRIDRGLHWIARAAETCPTEFAELRSDIEANFALWSQKCNRLLQELDHERSLAQPFPKVQPLVMAFHPGGESIATAGAHDRNVKLWSLGRGEVRTELEFDATIRALVYPPDGQHLVVVTANEVSCFDAAGDRVVSSMQLTQGAFTVHPESLTFAMWDIRGKIRLFSMISGKELPVDLEGELPEFRWSTALRFSKDGQRLLFFAGAGVRIWDTNSGKLIRQLNHEEGYFADANLDADVGVLVSEGARSCTIWSLSRDEALSPALPHHDRIVVARLSPDGQTLATVAGINARLFSTIDGSAKGGSLRHRAAIRGVAFSPDSILLATRGLDMAARLWTVADGRPQGVEILEDHYGVDGLAFNADGSKLAVSYGGKADVWSTNVLTKPVTVCDIGPNAWGVAFHPEKPLVAVAGRVDRVSLFNKDTGEVVHDMSGVSDTWTLALSHDGRRIATGCYLRGTGEWGTRIQPIDPDASGERAGLMLPNGRSSVRGITFSHDDRFVATGGFGKRARIWDATSAELLQQFSHPGIVEDLAFSRDDGTLITACSDGMVRYWSRASGEMIGSHDLGSAALALELSPDGNTIATGGRDQLVRFWDYATRTAVGPVLEHDQWVEDIAFRSDGRMLVTGCADGRVQLWSVGSGEKIGPPFQHAAAVREVAFDPDGRYVAGGAEEPGAKLWAIPDPVRPRDGFSSLATAITGKRMDENGVLSRLSREEWQTHQQRAAP